MTEFIPGAGPPPHRIPSFTSPSFQPQRNPDKRRVSSGGSTAVIAPAAAARAAITAPHGG
jgi:hypothetical protein